MRTKKPEFVTAETLIEELFEPEARPSMRWLKEEAKSGRIPYARIGKRFLFPRRAVIAALCPEALPDHPGGPLKIHS